MVFAPVLVLEPVMVFAPVLVLEPVMVFAPVPKPQRRGVLPLVCRNPGKTGQREKVKLRSGDIFFPRVQLELLALAVVQVLPAVVGAVMLLVLPQGLLAEVLAWLFLRLLPASIQ